MKPDKSLSRKDAAMACYRSVDAIVDVIRVLEKSCEICETVNAPVAGSQLRGVLQATACATEHLLNSLAGPVWGELPEETREKCRKSGM